MKKKEFQELKTMPIDKLNLELKKLRNRLNNLRFGLAVGKVKNIKENHNLKKSIARILTLIKEKEREINKETSK